MKQAEKPPTVLKTCCQNCKHYDRDMVKKKEPGCVLNNRYVARKDFCPDFE